MIATLLATFDAGEDGPVRWNTCYALRELGRARGTQFWWIIPRVYWKQIVGLLLLLLLWFSGASRWPRHRPARIGPSLRRIALTASVPVFLACWAVLHAITRSWAVGLWPRSLTLLPFPAAAVLSTAFASALPAVWVCLRKPAAPQDEPPATDSPR